jgi:ribose 5-phosphate isomerase B
MKQVITAQDVPVAGESRVARGSMLTPSVREVIQTRGGRLTEVALEELPAAPPEKTVAIEADHGGFELKEMFKPVSQSLGLELVDVGIHEEKPVDYPDLALEVARFVASGKATRGVMIDRAAMVANKVPGLRAAPCYDRASARNSREHNDSNVLTPDARLLTATQAEDVVRTWIGTSFAGGRHQARLDKILAIEQQYLKRVPS